MSIESGARVVPASRSRRRLSPANTRRLLERLGPIFVKVGQYLALRPDLVGQDYCEEFLKLTDRMPAFPFEEAARIIAEDLGGPPEQFFSWINPRPVAAGSLAQVHAAITHDREEVAIKVQRPGIRKLVERDLGRARLLVRILESVQATTAIQPGEVVEELTRWMHEELDLGLELRNLTRLYRLSLGNGRLLIPRPYPRLSGSRVLTAEFVPGVPLSEVLEYVRSGRADKLRTLSVDPEQLARNLLYSVLDQVFRLEFFHADIHPGNVLVMAQNKVGFVDFGLTDALDPQFRQSMLRYLTAVAANDIERMFEGLSELLVSGDGSDVNRLRTDFYEESARWLRGRQQAGQPDSPTSRYLMAVLRSARRNRFRVPPSILSLYRTLLTAETMGSQLGLQEGLAVVGKPLFDQLRMDLVLDALRPDNLQPVLLDGLNLINEGPRNMRRLLADIVDGRLVLRVRTVDSDEDRKMANSRVRLLSVAIASVGLASLIGATQGALLFGRVPVTWLLWGLLVAAWLWIAAGWRELQ